MPTGSEGGGGIGSGAIRAGRAFVELFIEDNALYRSLDKIKSHILGSAGFMAKIGGGAAALGSAILGPLAVLFHEVTDHLEEVKSAAERLSTTPEIIEGLGKAAKESGVEMDVLEASLGHMQKTISEAAHSGGEAADAFRSVGLDARSLVSIPLDKQLGAVADALSMIKNDADRSAMAMTLLGKEGRALLPLLGEGGGKIREGIAGVDAAEIRKQVEEASRFKLAILRITDAIKSVPKSLVLGFLGHVEIVEEFTNDVIQATVNIKNLIKANFAVVQTTALVAAGLVAAGTAMIWLSSAIAIGGFMVGGLVTVMSGIATAVSFLLTPLGLVSAAIVGLGAWWVTSTEEGKRAVGAMAEGFVNLGAIGSETLGGVLDAIKAGEWGLAMEIAVAGMEAAWAQGVLSLMKIWNEFKDTTIGKFGEAVIARLTEFLTWLVKKVEQLNGALERNGWGLPPMFGKGQVIPGAEKNLPGAPLPDWMIDPATGKRWAGLDKPNPVDEKLGIAPKKAEDAKDPLKDQEKRVEDLMERLRMLRANAFFAAAPNLVIPDADGGFAMARALGSQFTGSSKGAFSGPHGQQLAVGDQIPAKTLLETTKIRQGVEGLPAALADKLVMGK